MNQLNVHFLPEIVPAEALARGTSVVIDVLRATTTIVYTLAAGARAVIPCLTIEGALARAARLPRDEVVLAGERGGLPIDGFDLGNSPAEFTARSAGGKYVVLTTTNGTKALLHCRHAERILIGSFANISALCSLLSECPRVDLVCAGTDGEATEEDSLLAGAIADRVSESGGWTLDQHAQAACNEWRGIVCEATGDELTNRIKEALSVARGGRNLIRIGMHRDIETAAQIDRCNIVPRFDPVTGEVTAW